MRKILKAVGVALLVAVGLLLAGGVLCAVEVFSREPLKRVPSTTHRFIGRKACLECHAPIANGRRQSFHGHDEMHTRQTILRLRRSH
jgi:hypothetical protein